MVNRVTERAVGPIGEQYPRRWFAAIVMMVAMLMDLVDVTIVNVALPTVRRELRGGWGRG